MGLGGGYRWDAVSRIAGSSERSLIGGLRYSLQGGSFAAFRDQFQWVETPTVAAFQAAVEQAFAAWASIDPATGLHTNLSFVADLATEVVGSGSFGGVDRNGAEIDLLAMDANEARVFVVTNFDVIEETVTLTSHTPNYPGSSAISGVDITINNNAGARQNLNTFRRLLTHEIGHALGLGDVETAEVQAEFIDDNYDAATALGTLTNSWALKVNPLNPAASPLNSYVVAGGNPGNDTPGVNLLMESVGLGIAAGNPVTSLVPLTSDEFGTRQFLYPSLVRDITVTGDYNGNGRVDAADYIVWRNTLNQTVFWPGDAADGDESGDIDVGDYEFWKMRFGNVIPAGAGNAAIVPEPAANAVALLGLIMLVLPRQRVRR